MNEKASINVGILKEKELLEKLSREISRDFSIGEKLAKKLIYKTHLSLEDLKDEIYLEQKENNTESKESNLDDDNLNRLLSVLDGVRKLIEQASKNEIQELKNILENNSLVLNDDSEIVKKIFPKKILEKAKNPSNISEHIMGASLGIASSAIIITEILYSLGKGIITSIPDIISLMKGESEISSFKKV